MELSKFFIFKSKKMKNLNHLVFAVLSLCHYSNLLEIQPVEQIDVTVITANKTESFKRFWDNTGLSAPGPGKITVDYLGSTIQQFNLALIGAIPFQGVSHVRIHWLLDLISTRYTRATGKISYDFSRLDKLISWLYDNGLHPGFELMGNPEGLFSNMENNATQIKMWKDLIYTLASRYKDKYGLAEVEKWRFETWNEPDLKMYNILNLTLQGYLNYVNASREGLNACSPKLQLFGPAGVFKTKLNHPICWGLLEFCENQIAHNNSCFIDALTFHKKGNGSAEGILEESLQLYKEFQNLFQHLSKFPIANDESDVLTGWWREEEWRGDVRYAASVCQTIALFHNAKKQLKIPLQYISNDNAFLNIPPGYFNQRTLLTRFVINNTDRNSHNQFIRKPVYIAMAMLAYLGGYEVPTVVQPKNSKLSVLATCSNNTKFKSWSCSVLLILNSHLDLNTSKTSLNIKMKLPINPDIMCYAYLLDNNLPHPVSVWNEAGKPIMPSNKLLKQMRKSEGPHRLHATNVLGKDLNLQLHVTTPSIALVHVCSRPSQPPGQVNLLPPLNVTFNEVLLFWKDTNVGTRCIKTYDVQFCRGNCTNKIFKRINKKDIILLAFQYVPEMQLVPENEATVGLFRVRAVDYWGQAGLFSNVIAYGFTIV